MVPVLVIMAGCSYSKSTLPKPAAEHLQGQALISSAAGNTGEAAMLSTLGLDSNMSMRAQCVGQSTSYIPRLHLCTGLRVGQVVRSLSAPPSPVRCDMATLHGGLAPTSAKLVAGAGGDADTAFSLPIFGSRQISRPGNKGPADACIAFTGGPACTISWQAGNPADDSLHLAVRVAGSKLQAGDVWNTCTTMH